MGNTVGGARGGNDSFQLSDSIVRYIKQEFDRVRADKNRDYLVLDEVLQMKSLREIPVELKHLGTLYVLDGNHDGRVTLDELLHMAAIFGRRQRVYKANEFETQMRAYCTLQMWRVVSSPGGVQLLTKWLTVLLSETLPVEVFPRHPHETFLNRDAIKTMHDVLNIRASYGIDLQELFDLMQRVGEEMGLMSLEDEELDDVVPLTVVSKFCSNFTAGFIKLMTDLGFPPGMEIE